MRRREARKEKMRTRRRRRKCRNHLANDWKSSQRDPWAKGKHSCAPSFLPSTTMTIVELE